ncbi:type I polyketide synthase [Streptacidiphilus anmyonensis]|uniref:type I polyketide synthase n=1 Tax=Streptacidiphilus anmyonensis TaxID=405782 RepID=UPI0005A9D0A8|nr:type I polyketide synthase [Streptacidiphilus anmyonensis]
MPEPTAGPSAGPTSGPIAGPIAVVGLDCRFPGAADPDAFWRMLLAGAESVAPRPASRGAQGEGTGAPGGFLDDADAFDHAFFGISRADAAAMDPQQRLLLQTAWRALEDAGLSPLQLAGSSTGVFVGAMADDWARLQLSDTSEPTPRLGIGAGRSMLANRLSYQLDLRGPSLTVDSACSSALLAVHLAVNSLLAGECDTAVVGGVNLVLTDALDAIYRQAGLAAPDGRCKPFGAASDGIGRAEGVGAVVLRRAADARRDGQLVHALLLGSAVNQDGRSNGIMAPSRRAQREVMLAACRRAGVEPAEVSFVEAHGTGTPIGDLIEARALGDVYGPGRAVPCGIGSVKGNIGHAEGAAGIAGLIKATLALRHGVVPPLATVGGEHPGLALRDHGLRLIERPEPLPADVTGVLIGVSSFGMGGSNAHVILAGAPREAVVAAAAVSPAAAATDHEEVSASVFTLTAPSAQGLRRNAAAQADALARLTPDWAGEPAAVSVGRVCWTSNRVRTGQPYRLALAAADLPGLVEGLRDAASGEERCGNAPGETPVLGFLFTGQGAQYPGMTARLYRESALYRHHLDLASRALDPHLPGSVVELLLRGDEAVHRTEWTQPCVFAVEYALAASLAELGVRPDSVVGHSIGEFAAAVAAEALTLDEAAAVVAARATAMGALPEGGGMLAVRADADALAEIVAAEPLVSLAAVNGPGATVLAGDLGALARLRERFAEQGTGATALKVSHAFHSTLMEPVLPEFLRRAGRIPAGSPRLPMFSTVTGAVLDHGLEHSLDADYWCAHITGTVRFADAAQTMLRAGITHLVELGPKPVLLTLARRVPGGTRVPGFSVLSGPQSGAQALAAAAAELYRQGAELSFDPLYTPGDQRLTRLLPQVFDDSVRLWRRPSAPVVRSAAPPAAGHDQAERERDRPARTESPAEAVPASVAAVLGVDAAEVGRYDRFYDDLGFDSVMLMELKTLLEERLPALGELALPEMMAALVSVDSLVSHLDEQLALSRAA